MLPIQERPLLRVGEVLLVLDEQYLIERATQGLYWFVHEHERGLDGERGWKRWNGAYANMVERRVEDQLRRMAPPLLGGGSAFFTEEDLQAAFPRSKNTDAGIDFGELALLAEVVTAQAALATRENADVTAYGGGHREAVREEGPAAGRDRRQPAARPAAAMLPAGQAGAPDPAGDRPRLASSPSTRSPAGTSRTPCAAKAPQLPAPRRPRAAIAPVDLKELEMCETLHETRGLSLHALITQWQESADFTGSSFRSFLSQAYGAPFARPADLQAELARTLTLIAKRLGTGWSPGLPEPGQPAGTD